MASIQNGEAQLLTFIGSALALAFENSVCVTLQSENKDVYVSYSEGGLQSESTRFKLLTVPQNESILTLPFSQPRSGLLFFASADPAATARVTMWQI